MSLRELCTNWPPIGRRCALSCQFVAIPPCEDFGIWVPSCNTSVVASRIQSFGIALGLCVATSGCVRVKAHQRERLAHPAMQGEVWIEQSKADQHVFEVREASKGATGTAGGGCGCN